MSGGESLLAILLGTCHCSGFFECDIEIDNHVGIVVCFLLMVYMFKALGTICDEYFVPSLEVIVEKLQISNDVAGATFMAAGSSAPELFTALVATFLIVSSGGVGTIVGSAIFNIFVIVGVTGLVACKDRKLKIWWYPLTRDCTFYLIAIGELLVVLWDERVEWYEGLVMVLTYLCYIIFMKFNSKIIKALGIVPLGSDVEKMIDAQDDPKEVEAASKEGPRAGGEGEEAPGPPAHHLGVETPAANDVAPNVMGAANSNLKVPENKGERRPSQGSQGSHPKWSMHEVKDEQHETQQSSAAADRKEGDKKPEEIKTSDEDNDDKPPTGIWKWVKDPINLFWELTLPTAEKNCWVLFALSIFYIGVCTFLMVDAVGRMGCILNIPPFVMGCTFLAAGTSIPDALGSVAVAKQGEGDMAVANALGSNVFDILLGLGIPWTIATAVGKEVVFAGAKEELTRGIFILVGVLLVFIGALAVGNWYLSRWLGISLMSFYLLFVAYNVVVVVADI